MTNSDNIRQKIKTIDFAFWAGVVFFAVVIGFIFSFGLFLNERLSEDESVPVTSIVIMGEMKYTEKDDVESAIENIGFGNFFKVDVNTVQETVKTLPWVYSVSVRKQWPNELKIYVVDQRPIANWNGDSYINVYGEVFQVGNVEAAKGLPGFYGPEGTESLALKNYQDLNQLLSFGGFNISELVLSERYAWQLTLTSGVTLNLGRENRVERIQRFMDAYPNIELKEDIQIDYVDLRYDTGFAVGFKSTNMKERV
jgi:cell division protein FtsQ